MADRIAQYELGLMSTCYEVTMRLITHLPLLAIIIAGLQLGCEEDVEKQTLKEARQAVKASQYDLALKKFKALLPSPGQLQRPMGRRRCVW